MLWRNNHLDKKTGIIIQARTGSTRLPNKMMIPFYQGNTILEILIERLKSSFPDFPIILATTRNQRDDAIETIGLSKGIYTYRGDEENVLKRFVLAAEYYRIDKIIRVCADNPFLDMFSLKVLIDEFTTENYDYLFFSLSNEKPTIITHYGLWAEAVSLSALKKILDLTQEKIYLEHVTKYIYENRNLFNLKNIYIAQEIESINNIRLTIDTKEDFNLIKKIYEEVQVMGLSLDSHKLVQFISKHEDWIKEMEKQIGENEK
jgi:spore coat polysaccharide biosynthesis protein SpsF